MISRDIGGSRNADLSYTIQSRTYIFQLSLAFASFVAFVSYIFSCTVAIIKLSFFVIAEARRDFATFQKFLREC